MKYHVQFLEESIVDKNITVEAYGSDSVFILDGRNTLVTMVNNAKEQMKRLNGIHKYVGFIIKEGSQFGRCACIYTDTGK